MSPTAAPARIVTLGETMALVAVPIDGRLAGSPPPSVSIGGAESNVAIALSRLGVDVAWVSRVGDDALGRAVVRELRAEGVVVLAEHDPAAQTGMMVKECRDGRPRQIRYYRADSAASRLDVTDIDRAADAIAAASVLHLTGITAALGDGPRRALEHAIAIARDAGTLVSFDINDRRSLWPPDRAATVLRELVSSADLVFAGPEEADLVLGRIPGTPVTPERGLELAAELSARGPRTAVVKLGEHGAVAVLGGCPVSAPTHPVTVVDEVGAGDAFVGGYLSRIVHGASVAEALEVANLVGGIVCGSPGDWEALPTAEELTAARCSPPGAAGVLR